MGYFKKFREACIQDQATDEANIFPEDSQIASEKLTRSSVVAYTSYAIHRPKPSDPRFARSWRDFRKGGVLLMTEKTVGRILVLCLTLAGLCLLASCGAEPPWFASVDPEDVGDIIVRSTPEGAAIFLDGEDQQATTPHTLMDLEPGDYVVTVTAEGFVPDPAQVTVGLQAAETDSADFYLTLPAEKTVILEGFSNVSCPPCPELTENLVAMMAKPEFPADRVLFIEFAVSWPQLADPFFLANAQENADRYGLYSVAEAPDLYINGIQQADPLDAGAMESAVLADLELDPGFEITVSADFSSDTVPVTVILAANRTVDLTGHVLYVAIYEKEVSSNPHPASTDRPNSTMFSGTGWTPYRPWASMTVIQRKNST